MNRIHISDASLRTDYQRFLRAQRERKRAIRIAVLVVAAIAAVIFMDRIARAQDCPDGYTLINGVCVCDLDGSTLPTATPEPTIMPTTAPIATATPEPVATVEPTVEPTVETIVSTNSFESFAEAMPNAAPVIDAPAFYTNTVSVEPEPIPTAPASGERRIEVQHPAFVEVFTMTESGEITGHSTHNTVAVVVPVLGGQPSLLDRLAWAVADMDGWAILGIGIAIMALALAAQALARRDK